MAQEHSNQNEAIDFKSPEEISDKDLELYLNTKVRTGLKSKTEIKYGQQALARLGHYQDAIDGVIGKNSRKAMRQVDHVNDGAKTFTPENVNALAFEMMLHNASQERSQLSGDLEQTAAGRQAIVLEVDHLSDAPLATSEKNDHLRLAPKDMNAEQLANAIEHYGTLDLNQDRHIRITQAVLTLTGYEPNGIDGIKGGGFNGAMSELESDYPHIPALEDRLQQALIDMNVVDDMPPLSEEDSGTLDNGLLRARNRIDNISGAVARAELFANRLDPNYQPHSDQFDLSNLKFRKELTSAEQREITQVISNPDLIAELKAMPAILNQDAELQRNNMTPDQLQASIAIIKTNYDKFSGNTTEDRKDDRPTWPQERTEI